MPADAAKAAALLFFTVVVQLSIVANIEIFRGHPNLLLVTVVCVALLRGAIFGAVAGFSAGLLADTGVFGTLGFTALLLTLAGYWSGRYGETTGRDRSHAPLLSIAAPAGHIFGAIVQTILLNLILTIPVYALTRRLLRPREWSPREVRLLG
jgi:rod shape-determining protein MreD